MTKTLNLTIQKSKYEKVNGVKLSSWTPYNRLCRISLILAPILSSLESARANPRHPTRVIDKVSGYVVIKAY